MANMAEKKVKMSYLEPNIRNHNFEEVALGYSSEEAIEEATRCLNCIHKPCISGCPVKIDIPAFIAYVAVGEFEKAFQVINESSALPAVCGRVCPQESQCEKVCVRKIKHESVGIGRLERFVADWHRNNVDDEPIKPISNNHKVGIVGAGPAGLTCAQDLAIKGYDVTIFEALHVAGGVLMYGIPEFRLPKEIVKNEINNLIKLGVKIETNYVVGRSTSIDELMDEGFEAIFVGSGAGLPSFMNMPGENLKGVYSANEFLTRCNLMKAYESNSETPILVGQKAAIVGGGNVAMDAARVAKRIGFKEVSIVYRRSIDELPACKEEVEHAQEEGIEFKLLVNPKQVFGDDNGWVNGMECVRMKLLESGADGRRQPVEISNSNFKMDIDCMIMAIGTTPNPLIISTTKNLKANKRGCLIVDEDNATSKEGVYAGGDAVSGAATVIQAMGAGKIGAKSIDEFIKIKAKN